MPPGTLCVPRGCGRGDDAERRRRHSHGGPWERVMLAAWWCSARSRTARPGPDPDGRAVQNPLGIVHTTRHRVSQYSVRVGLLIRSILIPGTWGSLEVSAREMLCRGGPIRFSQSGSPSFGRAAIGADARPSRENVRRVPSQFGARSKSGGLDLRIPLSTAPSRPHRSGQGYVCQDPDKGLFSIRPRYSEQLTQNFKSSRRPGR
jgi:hypothetical protein